MEGAGFAFDTANMDFNDVFATMPQQQQSFAKPNEGNTFGFFGDEGIDTAASFIDPTLFSTPSQDMSFMSQNLAMDNTMSNTMWNSHLTPESLLLNSFPATPTQPLEMYQPNLGTSLGKRPRQLDVDDFTRSKRHESTGDYTMSSLSSASPQNDTVQGLSDEAADVCTTWFNKYAVLPSDRHIDSLSQLTGESSDAIRQWFGRLLKQGMGGQDSAYKSQTEAMPALCWSDSYTADLIPQQALEFPTSLPMSQPSQESTATPQDRRSSNDTTVANLPASTLRSGKKQRCTPTDDRDLLARDPNKIYQCTRKCGKRYGRKCDWKRNEEEGYPCKSWVCSLCVSEGVENVRPCFRKYHFVQHFRNIHPDMNSDEYEQASVVCSETEFPRNCGFCKHKFDSRQDRIDHIADHFKQGKCMLDWNDEGNDDGGSGDNTDDDNDDNDKPSGDGYDGAPSHPPPESDPRDNYGSKYYGGGDYAGGGGGGSGSNGGPNLLPDSFFGFKLSSEANTSDAAKQPQSNSQLVQQRLQATPEPEGSSSPKSNPSEGCSIIGRHASTTTDDQTSLAGDALSGRLVGGAKFPSQPLVARGLCVSKDGVGMIPDASDQQSFLLDSQTDPAGQNTKNSPVGSSYRTEELLISTADVHDAHLTGSAAPTVQKESTALSPAVLDTLQQFTPQSFLSVRLLGAGGFSTVDEVLHRATNLRLVRKTLKNRDITAIEELKKEVDVLQKLRHPHVIRFLGAYSKGDKMSILVSPVAETTLALWLEQATLQQPANLVHVVNKMFGCLVSSVRYLHEQRPVVKHMDIKPQNILVAHGDQEFPHVVLCDFGISSSDDVSDDQHKPLTRRYVAPEVLNGFARKQAADIWSLGCVFAEMASAPFGQSNSRWNTFRREYSGRTGKHYWQDVPSLQGWLSGFLDQAATPIEQQVIGTLKGMLSADPNERPSAALLSIEFTPAPCCLEWPNDRVAFPTPDQELEVVESLTCQNKDCGDHLDIASVGVDQRQDTFKNAKSWIEECDHTHDACRQVAAAEKVLPTRLIDTQPEGMDDSVIRIVDGISIAQDAEAVKYATLSYVWSKTSVTLTSDGLPNARLGLQRHALPTVLESGIQAAQKLGFRYVYVDSLCVLQDSEADKQAECALMASVFRNAALTIVLDQIDELDMQPGLVMPNAIADAIANVQSQRVTRTTTSSGVLPDANANAMFKNANRTTDRRSASSALPLSDFATPGFGWDTRAWSLQERLLSRRLLHLCETQLYWECASLKASDTFPRGLSSLVWEKAHTKSRHDRAQRGKSGSRSVTVKNVEAYDTQTRPEATRLRNCQWIHKEGQEKHVDSPYAFVQPDNGSTPLSSKGVFAPKYARKNSSAGEEPCNPRVIEATTTTTIATEDRTSPDTRSRSPFLKGLFALSAMAESRTPAVAANSTSSTEKPSSVNPPTAESSSECGAFSRLHSSASAPPARGNDNATVCTLVNGPSNCVGITAAPFWDSDGRRKQQELGGARTMVMTEHPLCDGVANTLAHHLESAAHSHPCCVERGVVGSSSGGGSCNENGEDRVGGEEGMN